MGPRPTAPKTEELFVSRLEKLINLRHSLVRLDGLIVQQDERTFGAHFSSRRGRPALPPRLVAGLMYLQHAFDASDQAVVLRR